MENAELYSTANGMQKKDAQETLVEFQNRFKWKEGSKILDIGCGSGEVTTEILLPKLPKDFRSLVGLDVSLEMIQHARNLHSHPKVTFIQFDIAQKSENILEDLNKNLKDFQDDLIPIKEEDINLKIFINDRTILDCPEVYPAKFLSGFDFVFSFYCLHWIPNQRLALSNIYHLLRPGGESLLLFLAKSPIFTLYRKLSTLDPWKKYMQDVDNFIPFYQDSSNPLENFVEMLKTTGFEILSAECREKSYAFGSFYSLKNAISAVNPFVGRMPHHLQQKFVDECLKQTEILQLAECRNGSYTVNYKLIIAYIKKPF